MKQKSFVYYFKKYIHSYLMVAPFFILFAVFGIYPMFYSLFLSFTSWTPREITFIGLDNFRRIAEDTVWWISVQNTLWLFVINVPLMTFLAVVIAYIFNDRFIKCRRVFQLIYLLPYVTSIVAVSIVFQVMFDDNNGWVNATLYNLGLPTVGWLRSQTAAIWTYNIVIIWQWVGYNMLILLGGLQSIDNTLYEAAYIDGSTRTKNLFYITIPHLRPVIWFCFIMSTIGTFNALIPSIVLFGGGGPGRATHTMAFWQYVQTFQNFRLGYGAALAFMIMLFTFAFAIPQVVRGIKDSD